jgi:hypothetical protein
VKNDDNRSTIEIHPHQGIKMSIVTDKWIRICLGIAVILAGASIFALAITPLMYAIRWW